VRIPASHTGRPYRHAGALSGPGAVQEITRFALVGDADRVPGTSPRVIGAHGPQLLKSRHAVSDLRRCDPQRGAPQAVRDERGRSPRGRRFGTVGLVERCVDERAVVPIYGGVRQVVCPVLVGRDVQLQGDRGGRRCRVAGARCGGVRDRRGRGGQVATGEGRRRRQPPRAAWWSWYGRAVQGRTLIRIGRSPRHLMSVLRSSGLPQTAVTGAVPISAGPSRPRVAKRGDRRIGRVVCGVGRGRVAAPYSSIEGLGRAAGAGGPAVGRSRDDAGAGVRRRQSG